jgi:hypothetical protein
MLPIKPFVIMIISDLIPTTNKTFKVLFYYSVDRLPASPTAKKKQSNGLSCHQNKKAQQDKARLSMKTKHQAKSLDKAAKQKRTKYYQRGKSARPKA